ncbi:MAG: DUF1552 domain-containing protein [Deltaproteobacteria bacterium]
MANAKFLSRRRFLTGTAGACVALPLLESLGKEAAWAQSEATRKRFLSFHSSSGVNVARFRPRIGPLDAQSFQGLATEPLAPYADRILIPRGIHGYPVGTFSGHREGTGQALTAASIARGGLANGASIDQIIARELTGREALVLRPGGRDLGEPMFNSISYTGPRELFSPESDPWRAYRSMMGFGSGAPVERQAQASEAVLARRQSVLDLVQAELAELDSMRLSLSDRQKLDQHFQLIRDLELRMSGNLDLVGCGLAPEQVTTIDGLDRERVEANENFPTVARLHVQITALALACGYTRSAVLQWGAAVAGSPMYQWDGLDHHFRHHPLSHGTTDDFNSQQVDGYRDMLFDIDRWNMQELKKLLDLLDSYTEANGRTLLDNTVVLYSNEFSDGQGHTTGDLPILIAGGAGYFKLGQSILARRSDPIVAGVGRGDGNSNRLLCTVLNAVGVPTSRFSDGAEGELAELRA